MEYELQTPLNKKTVRELRAGDTVRLTGEIYTARDAAHARMAERINEGKGLPFSLDGACVYYAGPTPAPEGAVIGSVGPTTAGRMDKFTPLLLANGLVAMIGKGNRSEAVVEAIQKYGAVYFGFIGGAGALASARVEACEMVAWEDLGSEAVRRLRVKDFPLTVLVDSAGGDLYKTGPKEYLAARTEGALPKAARTEGVKHNNVDAYLAALEGPAREWVGDFVRYMRQRYPDVSEGLAYQIPTFKTEKTFIAFSGAKESFSFQTADRGMLEDLQPLMPYASFGSKATVKVPYDRLEARPLLRRKIEEILG